MMKDSEILSTFHELDAQRAAAQPQRALIFDACQLGVLLRAVLFVELVMAIGALFGVSTAFDWVLRLAILTGAALPGTLAWLVVACISKKLLARLTTAGQYAAGIGLGALAGLYGGVLGAGAGDGALGVVDDHAQRHTGEPLEGAAVATQPGGHRLVPDELHILMAAVGQRHHEGPGAPALAVGVGERGAGAEEGSWPCG